MDCTAGKLNFGFSLQCVLASTARKRLAADHVLIDFGRTLFPFAGDRLLDYVGHFVRAATTSRRGWKKRQWLPRSSAPPCSSPARRDHPVIAGDDIPGWLFMPGSRSWLALKIDPAV
jgi:hypothetical protein